VLSIITDGLDGTGLPCILCALQLVVFGLVEDDVVIAIRR